MNLSADRRTLESALGLLSGLAQKKMSPGASPLHCVHASATRGELADELSLTATDGLDILTLVTEAEVEAEGRLITPLSALLALVQAEPGPSLTLKADRSFLKVQGSSVRGSVATADPETFPTLFKPPETGWAELPRPPLWEAIERAMPLSGVPNGVSAQGLDGVLVRTSSGETTEILSWHGWRATLEEVKLEVGVDFQAVVTHGNWQILRKFDMPTVSYLGTASRWMQLLPDGHRARSTSHHLWRQPGMLLACRRSEKEDRWPAADNQGLALLRQPAENGLSIAWDEANQLLGSEKAIEQCAGVPMTIAWDGKELTLSRENDVNSATFKLPIVAEIEPWRFQTKDHAGLFGCLSLAAKSKQAAVLSPWEFGLKIKVGQLTGSLAPYS